MTKSKGVPSLDEPQFFRHKRALDERGWLANVNPKDFGFPHVRFCHSFISMSDKNVLRGFHFQVFPDTQAKIVHVLDGEILDVSFSWVNVKARPSFNAELLGPQCTSDTVFLPETMAHAFLVTSKSATLLYLNTSSYVPRHAKVINPLRASSGFDWGLPESSLILSSRDSNAPSLTDYIEGKAPDV